MAAAATSLKPRQGWMCGRVSQVLGVEENDVAKEFMRERKLVDALMDGSGKPKLFALVNETGDAKEVALTDDIAQVGLSRAVYFIRNAASVDVSKSNDNALLFGEVDNNPLAGLETMLSCVYQPLLANDKLWGKADKNQSGEFRTEMSKFCVDLQGALKHLVGGVELQTPDRKFDLDSNAADNPEMAKHFEQLLQTWCKEIEDCLGDEDSDPSNTKGLVDELEFWRRRMQNLTSITDQLKTREFRAVIGALSTLTKDPSRQSVQTLLRDWKQIDIRLTEAANEAKDNVKYLFTLERFVEPLYEGTPTQIVDAVPAMLNSIKMIYTIARYYSTTPRMTNLFVRITNQMIANCKTCILGDCENGTQLWQQDPEELVRHLEECLKLKEAYQEHYRLTKDKLASDPKGKQFDFDEQKIFGRFDQFCRRIIKLIDMFSTIYQFSALKEHKLEGMEEHIKNFDDIVGAFKRKRHDMLDYTRVDFDRHYVEFNVQISDLEGLLQGFINRSFESIKSIEHSLELLHKFQSILQRESLKADLDSKLNVIFQNYALELQEVQQLYEKHKHKPPIQRNMPPVAGNISWSRHLLKRIEEPMKTFEANQNVLASADAKKIIRVYNKVARMLVAFEYLWFQAWVQSIEQAKSGLQATLIIRHPDDGKLYVNFDREIMQLIREAKCLERMGIEIPTDARIVLLQEAKFKSHFNELQFALTEYERVLESVIPVTGVLLRPQFNDMEFKLRPGMITLTWTSMNIDAYKQHVAEGVRKLEELITNINDILENRVEKNLKIISKTMLVSLPAKDSFTLTDFVSSQKANIKKQGRSLQGKNVEVECAVDDLIDTVTSFELDPHIEPVAQEEVAKLKTHYNNFMYQALLHTIKNSLNAIKRRVASRLGVGLINVDSPLFNVDVHLAVPEVVLNPNMNDIQRTVNEAAKSVLECANGLWDWGQQDTPDDQKTSLFHRVAQDIEIVRVCLLLTGSVQGTRNHVDEYVGKFKEYQWLWMDDRDAKYAKFQATKPKLTDYESELLSFVTVERNINQLPTEHSVGALSLNTEQLKQDLIKECTGWKLLYADNLRKEAKAQMDRIFEYIRVMQSRVNREVVDLESLNSVMLVLSEVRSKESELDTDIHPILYMYQLLEHHMEEGFIGKEEMDMRSVLRTKVRKLVHSAELKTRELSAQQHQFKGDLLKDVRDFVKNVDNFRSDYLKNGPMVEGIKPMDAVERLNRYREEYAINERKMKLYQMGEGLFRLPQTDYPLLAVTKKDLDLQKRLFDLYVDVINTMEEWATIQWSDVIEKIEDMTAVIDGMGLRCKKMPAKLREWDAYKELKKTIEDFQTVLPLLQELSKPSIMERHWEELAEITKTEIDTETLDFSLNTLLDADIVGYKEDIEEITEGADKQLKIEQTLTEITETWQVQKFIFQEWKDRKVPILKAYVPIMEELEDAEMQVQTMLTMRHVAPFRDEAKEELTVLSETAETLERWTKVQMMWCSLESVFTGGDIAKQMPVEAKKFQKLDKDWCKLMAKAADTELVVECCANELLRTSLPVMYGELEKCQKSLEGYLEQKRNKFPRFYFVSDPGLLQILSQGSDCTTMNAHYEKVFDSIFQVMHDKKDKTIIHTFNSSGDPPAESIPFSTKVVAKGNIEDWLGVLLGEMQTTLKDIARNAAADIAVQGQSIPALRGFVDSYIAQFSLLGIQLLWTTDTQNALDLCRSKKTIMKETNTKMMQVLMELSSWCLQDLGSKMNRRKIETLITIHVHQRDVTNDLATLYKQKKLHDGNDFEWLKQARFSWRSDQADDCNADGAAVISITDVDFCYQWEYLGCKERLVITPLTDRCYITLAQACGMYFGGAPAGPAGTGKTETTKDLGRALGLWVVVTNCTDQQSYKDCAKIFKGLCQGGLWGCFDEFNRIQLPVLSVVAQQVLAIINAKKTGVEKFNFPGDPQSIGILPVCSFFITMNPGYAGRQELPENLKALFRGVTMMVPNFQIIMKVKLCSVGYSDYSLLAQKFFVLYNTCKEQLSNQKHYDWGLRNILSVLRTGGQTKRDNLDKPEAELMYRTLRDMNLSKLVAQDVPLFLSLLADLFPTTAFPAKGEYPEVEAALHHFVDERGLTQHADWILKVIQLYETSLVRHGIMLVGPTGGGKSSIFKCLELTLAKVNNIGYKQQRMNPKAIRAAEMYGEVDKLSGEWTTGCFAAIWKKSNSRANKFITWMVMDGPVDAIWIEDLNTVLDDNKILTLANGDRMPMTDNVKAMFEVETLINASPATVSRAGIIYVSDTDLDWKPILNSWLISRPKDQEELIRPITETLLGENTKTDVGHMIDFINRHTEQVMKPSRSGQINRFTGLLQGLMEGDGAINWQADPATIVPRLMLYSLCWSFGGLLEHDDRVKFHDYINNLLPDSMPTVGEHETIYEYFVSESGEWTLWRPPQWKYPKTPKLDFSNLLVPTMDSTRALYLLHHMHKQKRPALMVGDGGTAKTSTAYMFLATLDPAEMLVKNYNFSSATTPFMFQMTIEGELDKRGGKSFGPPNGKKMTFFLDDLAMPLINNWGDQPTLESTRLVLEQGYFTFLDKDKRGDFKSCEDLQYIAAMQHPTGGRNDIPNRLRSKFFAFNLVLPSITSINDMYGQMLAGRFTAKEFKPDFMAVVNKLTVASIALWKKMQQKMLPTPAKFHYVFNLRELSRVFQGVLLTPKETYSTGGGIMANEGKVSQLTNKKHSIAKRTPAEVLVNVWKHECERVFCDKLTNNTDKDWYLKYVNDHVLEDNFDEALAACAQEPLNMISCLREDIFDEEGVFEAYAPKIYEIAGELTDVRDRVSMFMGKNNEDNPQSQLHLVLFDDALRHLLRISRLIEMPRGSGMLVGVGGSGKQSLTRLASYISNAMCFQITLTKTYNQASLLEDLRTMYRNAGHQRKPTVFLFTESELKEEVFLETLNSVLMTGEVSGLFAKDEMIAMTADLQKAFAHERPGEPENSVNLNKFFIDNARDNLHLMMCMSPLNPMFPVRARKFPGIISGPTIDWFLPWPEDALVAVSKGLIADFPLQCDASTKEAVMTHMGNVHRMVVEVCDEYFQSMRRNVYQTPKSYLSFIDAYKAMYSVKLKEIEEKEARVNLGLEKLVKGAEDVEMMKVVLAEEQVKLDKATAETNKMLESLEASSAEATKESEAVAKIAASCQSDAERISAEKEACQADLAKAQPFVDEAETAIDSIKPAHIGEIKKLAKPADIIKLVFDGVLILFKQGLNPCTEEQLYVAKKDLPFIETSFVPHAQMVMGDSRFLNNLQDFGKVGKDQINEETIEFLLPYIELEDFTPAVAKGASVAAEGLCTWVRAMKYYHEASKIVKPKLEALAIAQNQLDAANAALAEAQGRLKKCEATLADLQKVFEAQMAEKRRIEEGAQALARKMNQAAELIGGLSGEQKRWTEDSNNFSHLKTRLVGDCAVACAFISYCGPFNQDFRRYMIVDKFYQDCRTRNVPATKDIDIIPFLVDIGTIGDWNMTGLPTDPLSIQNGILVTNSSRYPLLIDPQAQAITWISNKEKERLPHYGVTALNHPKIKDQLEFAMAEGMSFIVTGVNEEVDPMFDPVLEKQIVVKGKSKLIQVGDKAMDYDDKFQMFFITRLPNPHFSPELQAKTTVIDFTVTQKGLEEQLLGKVISKEQKALEDQLNQVLADVNDNTKALLALDAALLHRLTSNTGNLLEDEELIGVLANTKAKAQEVNEKIASAEETKKSINEKREQFRPVATRGAVIYFTIVELSLVNCMYQTSLEQFLHLFMRSMDEAEKAQLATKRVNNIIDCMTYISYRYINRGLYEKDKLLFVLLLTLKVLVTAQMLNLADQTLFLRAGAALDINSVRKKPFNWLPNDAWLNVMQLSMSNKFFAQLPNEMTSNEGMWRRWYDDNEPESMAIPDYEQRFGELADIGPFLKLLLVRSLRLDRSVLAVKQFIEGTPQTGKRFTEPVTDTIESIYDEMTPMVPVIFLLSPGADPTDAIETLARKRKVQPPATVSLGQGQEPVAIKAMDNAATNGGSWVLLQNCELGLPLMDIMEDYLHGLERDDGFRLFISALPNKDFPLGLLQMCTKVTNEPPAGLRPGLLRSYTVSVDQDRLERVETVQWRQLLFDLCFLHSVVQERRKFGPLGWCVPYEFNTGDLEACMKFLEKHLYNGPISWPTFQYMVAEAQYGGRITDTCDRRLFGYYASTFLIPDACAEGFTFNPAAPILKIPGDFVYTVPTSESIDAFRGYISQFPEIDSPEMFGLHPNADLTFRNKEANALLTQMGETQPKGGGSGGGKSPAEIVSEKAVEILDRMPEDYIEDEYKARIQKLGGLTIPLNIFLFQEVQRLQGVLKKVRFMLQQLILAIKGEVVMSIELQDALNAMVNASVPHSWVFTIAGDEFSWISPTLGVWVTSLMARDDQNRTWLASGRPAAFWMTGFFNPQGLLTAMKQEVTRKHKKDAWALDDVIYHTEVTSMQGKDNVRSPPEEGLYIFGLFLDGASWSRHDGTLTEQEPKKLFVSLPVMLVSANTKKDQAGVNRQMFGSQGPYESPVYKYPARTDRFFIFFANLKCTPEKPPVFWGLRGTALLENTE